MQAISIFRHPMLLKVFARLPSPDHCNEYDPPQQINKVHIPSFIPESQRKVVSTSEILGINYIDYVAPDKEANKDGYVQYILKYYRIYI